MTEQKIHILLVDDDPLMLRLFGARFAEAGYEVLPAHDGNEGREMARRLHPDLIMLDMRMPVMDGLETLSRMKAEEPTQDIPVILFTNEDLSIEAQKSAQELGASGYIHKGDVFENILKKVQEVLGAEKAVTSPDSPTLAMS